MRRFSLLLATLLLPAAALAQTYQLSFVTPRGAEFYEGNSSSGVMFSYANTRTQQVDGNLIGQNLPLIRAIGWRRNGGASSPAKSLDVTVVMAHADLNNVTNTYASNYKGPAATVFTRKKLNLVSWSNSVGTPAPFDMVIPFDAPFVYNRKDALLWEVVAQNNPTTAYTQDWISSVPAQTYGDYPTRLASGCATKAGRFTQEVLLRAGTNLEFGIGISAGPAAAAVLGLIGYQDPNMAIPGLCTSMRVTPLIVLNLGTTDASGNIPLPAALPVSLVWNPVLAGVPLYVQSAAIDSGQPGLPVALSDGLRCPAPKGAGAPSILCRRLYNMNSATSPTGSTPSSSAVPTVFLF